MATSFQFNYFVRVLSKFEETFEAFCNEIFETCKVQTIGSFKSFHINHKTLWLIPYSLYQELPPAEYGDIFIYQDQWIRRNAQVKNRLISLAGNTLKINARSCTIVKINKPLVNDFLEAHHVLGSCQHKFAFGLFFKEELVAVASFSSPLVMNDGAVPYCSYEILRYANIGNYTVVGGISKLINHFIKLKNPAHLMSYTDNDWGIANSYQRIGFHKKENSKPMYFWVNPKTNMRTYRKPEENIESFIIGMNRGNTKWILDLRQW